jgi:hypothetical protein
MSPSNPAATGSHGQVPSLGENGDDREDRAVVAFVGFGRVDGIGQANREGVPKSANL